MAKVTIYGASDDLIEIDGGIEEEFSPGEDDAAYLAFSDGTVLHIEYTDSGFWRITRRVTGTAGYEKHEGTNEDTDYSDRVTLSGVDWVVAGDHFKQAKS